MNLATRIHDVEQAKQREHEFWHRAWYLCLNRKELGLPKPVLLPSQRMGLFKFFDTNKRYLCPVCQHNIISEWLSHAPIGIVLTRSILYFRCSKCDYEYGRCLPCGL